MRHQSENRAAHRGTVRLNPLPRSRSRRPVETAPVIPHDLGLLHNIRVGGRRRRRTIELERLSRPWRTGMRRRS